MSTTSPQIPFNLIPTEPSLTDALNLLKKDIMLSLNCHHIGTIQSFTANQNLNAAPPQFGQTARAVINYPKTYFQLNSASGLYQPFLVSYPVLVDCPAIVLGGGGAALTMPVKTGDECLVLFNDRSIDNWFQGGAGAALATPRLHSFSDGIVLVGLRSQGNVLSTYDIVRAVLRAGSAVVGVNTSNSKVLISNATPTGTSGNYSYSTTLNTLLQTLITAVKGITTLNSDSTTGAVSAASQLALANAATAIGGLLE